MEIATRGAFRTQLTKQIKAASEFLDSAASQIAKDNIDSLEEQLVLLIQRLTAIHASVKAADQQILIKELVKVEDVGKELEKTIEYDDNAVSVIARLNLRLQKLRKFEEKGSSHVCVENHRSASVKSHTILPKLQLKKFDGDIKNWMPFWDQYDSAVHQNNDLSVVEKFNYLEGSLLGSAKQVVSGFTASAMCYDAAISLLREQYGDTEKLVDNHMQKLISLRPVSMKTDVLGLRNLYNTITTSIRSLTALHIPSQQYDVMLKSILLRCIPSELRVDYHRQHDKDTYIEKEEDDNAQSQVDDEAQSQVESQTSLHGIDDKYVRSIMRFLKKEVEAMERSKITPTYTNTKASPTTAASLIGMNTTGKCVFCESSAHATKDCDSSISLQSKRDMLIKSNRCFRCAKIGHTSRKCRSVQFLKCAKCSGKHLTTMCDPKYIKTVASISKPTEKTSGLNLNLCAHSSIFSNVLLKTARCIGVGKSDNLLIRVIIDGGSQHTFITEEVATKLQLLSECETVNMSVIPFGSSERLPSETFKKVKIELKSQYNNKSVLLEAVVVPQICIDVLSVPDTSCISIKKLKLADCKLTNMDSVDGLSILVGSDFYWTVVTGKQRRISNRLRAVQTIFGWTLQGFHATSGSATDSSSFVANVLSAPNVSDQELSSIWSLESIGIRGEELEKVKLTQELSSRCIKRVGARYEASLPWKDPDVIFESNRHQAVSRLFSLTRRLSRDPEKIKEYDAAVLQLIADGIAEPVDIETSSKRIFYLPHRPVYKEESTTTKLRIVFDASSHTDDIRSLNDQLLTGTNLLPDVLKTLLNFRLGRIGVVADIEKAFLQISLNKDDRDSHRFIWYSKLGSVTEQSVCQDFRMTRVTFGVSCSPFLLSSTIRLHLEARSHLFPETCRILESSFYMDDLVLSVDTEIEGIRIYKEAVHIMKEASMNLHKWHSNSAIVRNAVSSQEFSLTQKVLGLSWSVFSDELSVPLHSVHSFLQSNLSRGSKRHILQAIARVYDPLGIVCPTMIKLKILFQAAWRKKLTWDEALPPDLLLDWNDCVKNVLQLKDMSIPRSALSSNSSNRINCHIFADASLKAYGAVAYIKVECAERSDAISFLCAKSRIAPLRDDGSEELTLPKLELTAALIAARMGLYLKNSLKLPIQKFYFWTDSKITLHWIYGQMQRWKPYVQSRVVEIRRHTSISDWNHCCGKDNPADLITRGISGEKLQSSLLWAHGPKWLSDVDAYIDNNRQNTEDFKIQTTLLIEMTDVVHKCKDPILRCENFSSWSRLLRITSWALRFIKYCRKKEVPTKDNLTKEEIDISELYWLKYVQLLNFTNEIKCLQKNKPIPTSSKIVQLSPFLDKNGLMRLGGRLQLLDESFNLRHPIILPVNHHITTLVIDDTHLQTTHGGVNIVLTKIRERFWVIKGRQIIKKRIKGCIVCRKLFGQPASQPFAPLPIQRITFTRPFDNVGIDFAGPLYYKDSDDIMHKAYILIFTCAAIRAVHLEVTTNLTTESCIMALRRFMARRGVPSAIFSDNAKTFRRASLELSKVGGIFEDESVQGFLSKHRVGWHFIVERAPWWGGFWERLIRTIKNTLKVVVGKSKLNLEQLRTIIAEAEAIANERPLTYVSSEPLDLSPLTPAKFILGNSNSKEGSTSEVNPVSESNIRDLWKHRMKYSAKLAKRWRVEYLQLLRSFHYKDSKTSIDLKVGDIVLLFDPATPRIHWKMVIIDNVFPGRDGKVRSCKIRCADGSTLRRPVQLLYPVELPISSRAEGVEKHT